MLAYFVRRLVFAIPTLLAVLTLVFVLVRIVPGDPAQVILGDQASAAAIAALHERLGLDQPLWRQYLEFIGGALQGDWRVIAHFHVGGAADNVQRFFAADIHLAE